MLGRKVEIVPMDNKLSAQESLILLKSAIDQGIRYISQGNGSSVAGALIDAINKHNERNPGKAVVFLNYAAVDPDFTNDKCSFWHFRFDANSDMKMEALTDYMKGAEEDQEGLPAQPGLLVRPPGREGRRARCSRAKRPDMKIVGDELHPLARVKDFAPYIAKMQASGADTVITGNWGSDLSLLVKAAKDASLKADFYTYYGGGLGAPPAMGEAGVDRVKVEITGTRTRRTPPARRWSRRSRRSTAPTSILLAVDAQLGSRCSPRRCEKAKSRGPGGGRAARWRACKHRQRRSARSRCATTTTS